MALIIKGATPELPGQIRRMTGTDIRSCYQCGKCSAGCPIAAYSDIGPRQVMRLVQLGQREQVLRSACIWLCAGCEACSTRCPRDVGPSHVIDALRQISLREGYYEEAPPTVETIPVFHRSFLSSVRAGGRLWELFMVGYYKLCSMDLFSDIILGAKMFFRGKLKIIPPRRIKAASKILKKIAGIREEEALDAALEYERSRREGIEPGRQGALPASDINTKATGGDTAGDKTRVDTPALASTDDRRGDGLGAVKERQGEDK